MATTVITSSTAKIDFVEYVQDSLIMCLGYADSRGRLFDTAGWEVVIEIRKKSKDVMPLLSEGTHTGQVTVGIKGKYNINILITDQQTAALGKGEFVYFIRTTDTQGFVNTLAEGRVILRER